MWQIWESIIFTIYVTNMRKFSDRNRTVLTVAEKNMGKFVKEYALARAVICRQWYELNK